MQQDFWVADLRANGELAALTPYRYTHLEQLAGCAELIGHCSGEIWKSPESFTSDVSTNAGVLAMRWQATASTAGLLTLRADEAVLSVSVLASGLHADADAGTITALQRQLLHELHGTEHEAAFALLDLRERPLAATVTIRTPTARALSPIVAVADRCFAAAYFRYLRLV